MASDFNKLVYHSVRKQVEAQLAEAGAKLKKEEMLRLMDIAMQQFADSLVALVASVARAQAEAKRTMAPQSVPMPEGTAAGPVAEVKADPVVSEPKE